MGTKKAIRAISFLMFCLLIFSGLPTGTTPDSQATEVYVQRANTDWASAFSESFEILYLIMYDTSGFGLTTMEGNRINITIPWLEEYLAEEGYEISDIAIMIHNHFKVPHLSWGNGLVLMRLRERGFRGSFGVYHIPSDKIIWAKREK